MSEWMNEWMNEWVSEWMNERMKKQIAIRWMGERREIKWNKKGINRKNKKNKKEEEGD